ncbi:MAG: SOS response-associated peptidase [Actinomycetota bacterium]|nr:SOS response-associated peptidase [Actinomycetota bacterium]
MCGRFVSTSTAAAIASYFGATASIDSLGQNFNVAPTHDIYGVVADLRGNDTVQAFHWGLIPSWARERKIGASMINARSETITEKPAFRDLARKKRVLIPMDGFYEWKPGSPDGPLNSKGKPLKQPMFIERIDGQPLAVAGLWSTWKDPADPEQRWLRSATVITTKANHDMSVVHHRMPVLVPPTRWQEWLDPGNADIESLSDLFTARNDNILRLCAVSTNVNSVRNNTPDLTTPLSG